MLYTVCGSSFSAQLQMRDWMVERWLDWQIAPKAPASSNEAT